MITLATEGNETKRITAAYALLCSAAREHSYSRGRKEVHQHLFVHLLGKELQYLHVPAFSRFLASSPPDCFQQFPLLVLSLLAVADEMLKGVGTSLEDFIWLRRNRCHWGTIELLMDEWQEDVETE